MTINVFGIHDSWKDKRLLSPWTINHFWIGIQLSILFRFLSYTKLQTVIIVSILHVLYEAKDIYVTYLSNKYTSDENDIRLSDSWVNSIGDQIFFTIGIMVFLVLHPGIPNDRLVLNSLLITIFLFMVLSQLSALKILG